MENIDLKSFTLRELLTAVFEWSYENDLDLYNNLDDHFSAFDCRNNVEHERKKDVRNLHSNENFKPIPLLIAAIEKADYHDILRFRWTFVGSGRNRYTDKYVYESSKPHPYMEVISHIEKRSKFLKENKLDDWHKSADHKKHSHFRYWIDKFINDEERYHLRLLMENDTRCHQILTMGLKEEENFKHILQYVLDNNICPDPHRNKLEVQDFINPDIYNTRVVKCSGRFGGFYYLAYLTATELKEIYDFKIKKSKLDYFDKAAWQYIKEIQKREPDAKFYLFIT